MRSNLSFYDHSRQNYADAVPVSEPYAAEFMVGDYCEDGGCGPLGEFKIVLHRFSGKEGLSPQIQVFGDATRALIEFIGLGGLAALSVVPDQDALSHRLIEMGLRDMSDLPLIKA